MPKPTAYKGNRLRPLLASAAQTAASAEQTAADATTPDWNNVQNKPSEFPPEDHTHPVSDLENLPVSVTGARNDPEQALKNLLQKLEDAGLITDTTTAI
jgi:hypothetical protein